MTNAHPFHEARSRGKKRPRTSSLTSLGAWSRVARTKRVILVAVSRKRFWIDGLRERAFDEPGPAATRPASLHPHLGASVQDEADRH